MKKFSKSKIFSILTILSFSSLGGYFLLSRLGYLPEGKYFHRAWCLKNCDSQPSLHTPLTAEEFLNYPQPLSEILDSSSIDTSQTSILVEKSKFRLTLYYQNEPLKAYPIVLGENPVDDKLREGDKRTPEGLFKIRDLYPHDAWSKFLWLDYPTQQSWQKHLEAKRKGTIQVSDTIGGEIGIHGVPSGSDRWIDRKINWTWGCISLKNQDVDELYQVVQPGTTVEIIF